MKAKPDNMSRFQGHNRLDSRLSFSWREDTGPTPVATGMFTAIHTCLHQPRLLASEAHRRIGPEKRKLEGGGKTWTEVGNNLPTLTVWKLTSP